MTYLSLEFKLSIPEKDKEKLLELMRKQSSAIRIAYNMLKKGVIKHSQIYQTLKKLFPDIPTKYIDSASTKLNIIQQIKRLSLVVKISLRNFAKIT